MVPRGALTRSDDLAPLIAAILAISLVGVGLSLTFPLVAIRTEAAGFSGEANGFGTAMSGVATLIVSPFVPALVRTLGVRKLLFAALATGIASLLGLALIANAWWWFPLRFLQGCALTALFVVSEYAVNALSPPDRRGLWVGIYSTSLYLGFAIGPAILALVGTEGALPFYVAIALFVIAGGPIVAAGGRIPGFDEEARAPMLAMVARAPALMGASLLFGAIETGGMGLLPVHALRAGLDAQTGALFVSLVAIGNVAFQLPIGLAADRFDRGRLIAIIAFLGLAGALVLIALDPRSPGFMALLFVWAGLVGGLYMVGLAELGARYRGADLAAANSAFVMFYATGMLVGPPMLGATLDASPRYGLFAGMAALFAAYLAARAMIAWRRRREAP